MIFQMLTASRCHMSKDMLFRATVDTTKGFPLSDSPEESEGSSVSRKLWHKLIQICPDLDIQSINRQDQNFWDLIELHAEDNPEIISIASDILAEAMLSQNNDNFKP